MKTNSDVKRETIQEHWQKAGFIWDEIKYIVDEDGLLTTVDPNNLDRITGYSEAMKNCSIKWLGSMDGLYYIELSVIAGISKNNGWIRIEQNGLNLPDTTQDLLFTKRTDGRQEKAWYNGAKKYFFNNYTHFRYVDILKAPMF